MSSELRAKITNVLFEFVTRLTPDEAADRIIAEIASLNPPATAKLPEGEATKNRYFRDKFTGMVLKFYHDMKCVECFKEAASTSVNMTNATPDWCERHHGFEEITPAQLADMRSFITGTTGAEVDMAKVVEKARAYEEKCDLLESHRAARIVGVNTPQHVSAVELREDADNARSELFAAVAALKTTKPATDAALSAPPVPGESKAKTPAEVLKANWAWGTIDGRVFACAHSGDCVAILNAVDAQRARIAELEADNTRLRAQYDMVEQERTRLMLGQQVPYTPAEKPDARTIAPNGRAMVEWRRVDDAHVIGRDDSGQWWYWLYGEMGWEPCRLDPELFKPCNFDGTPITEPKPDPLARAMTWGDMQRLADIYVRAGMPTTAKFIRDAFTSTQGAAHAE